MSISETPQGRGATAKLGAARRRARHAVLYASFLTFALAAFPSLAGAITLAPLLGPVSATPSMTGATLNATVYPYGADTTYHFEYGTTSSYGTSIPVPNGDLGAAAYPSSSQATQTIGGLSPDTTYHYRIVASNSVGAATGAEAADKTFTTTGTPPTVTTEAATEIAGGFTLSGTVNPEGTATTYRFEYGTTTAYGTDVPVPAASTGSGSTAVPVSQDISGLLPNTTYHFRLSASHGTGAPVITADKTFLTPPSGPAPPSAVVSAPVPTASGFKLEGAINPNGVDTKYHFAFGEGTAYGKNLPEPDADIGSGTSSVAVSQEVTGLAPNTTYHYRIVAENAEGPSDSSDQTFTTPPLAPVLTATPFTESAAGWSLNGTVNANGGPTTYHFQFGITTAYGSNIPATDASAGSGTSPITVTQLVASLPPEVPYHYRLVAHNAGGTTTSNDEEFVTPPAASTPETPFSPPPLTPLPQPPAVTPPAPAPPSNQFTTKSALATGNGATMQVSVPGPGTVSATGKGLKSVTVSSRGPGVVTLKLKLTGAGMAQLKKASSHKLTVKIRISFQPNGGSVGTTSKTVTFKGAKT